MVKDFKATVKSIAIIYSIKNSYKKGIKEMKSTRTEKWKTKRLSLSDATIEECNELQRICITWDDKKLMEGREIEPDYIYKCITEGNLPPVPNADKENYRLKSMYLKDTAKLIGFTDMYYGYPSEDTIWISLFMIDKKFRRNGYGQEVINLISTEFEHSTFKKIGIGVHLKNWRALRFWTNAGFDKVLGILVMKNIVKTLLL